MTELVILDYSKQIEVFRDGVLCNFYNTFYVLPVMVVENFFRSFFLFYLTLE